MYILEKFSHLVCWLTGKTIFKFLFHFEVEKKEDIKELKGPLIVVFSHCSWLDPIFINAAIPPSYKMTPIRYATWYKHYYKFLPLLLMAGAFPVRKGIGLEKTLRKGLQILKGGGVVGIAPEGKRRHMGRPRKGRRGAAFLALKNGCPLLPVYIEGNLGLNVPDFFLRKRKIKVKIGKLFFLPIFMFTKFPDLNTASDFVMERIYELKREKNLEEFYKLAVEREVKI